MFAVGQSGTIIKYDGASWSDNSTGAGDDLFSLWGSSGINLHAGAGGTQIYHYGGFSWFVDYVPGGSAGSMAM